MYKQDQEEPEVGEGKDTVAQGGKAGDGRGGGECQDEDDGGCEDYR